MCSTPWDLQAFWQIPLHPEERKFFVAKLDIDKVNCYMVFLRTAQGSRGAPLCWARYAALIMRLTQSLYPPRCPSFTMLC